jgi:hypothetical protein
MRHEKMAEDLALRRVAAACAPKKTPERQSVEPIAE